MSSSERLSALSRIDPPVKGGLTAIESSQALDRYDSINVLAHEIFADRSPGGPISTDDIDNRSRKFFAEAALATSPQVWGAFWEHILIAPEMGKRVAQAAIAGGLEDIDPLAIEFVLLHHGDGRLVNPAGYLRNDAIGRQFFLTMGLGDYTDRLASLRTLLQKADELQLSSAQLKLFNDKLPLAEIFTPDQQVQADDYFTSLSPAQRITNLADNLGKRDANGNLFTVASFFDYLRNQEARYDQKSQWPSIKYAISKSNYAIPKRPASALLQAWTIEKSIAWLKETYGVAIEAIIESLANWGPKFLLAGRHGKPHNPKKIVYTRDDLMRPEDIIRLSDTGKNQIALLAKLIQSRGLRVSQIISSPLLRARQSAQVLTNGLGATAYALDGRLNDTYAPGPYLEGLSMDELQAMDGDVYDLSRWGKYDHERPHQIIPRMNAAFGELVAALKTGQAGILISHGDPLSFLANSLAGKEVPDPSQLRQSIYPVQGEAILVVIHPDGKPFAVYHFTSDELPAGEMY